MGSRRDPQKTRLKMASVSLIFAGTVYVTSLVGCYDGDTCRLKLKVSPPFLTDIIRVRFVGFDTPERASPQCKKELKLAQKARKITQAYMKSNPTITTKGRYDKYGRLLVSAPALKKTLLKNELASTYSKWRFKRGGKNPSWCG